MSNVKLAAGSLGIFSAIIMGIAGTAPAYSVEITTSTLTATAGVFSPAAILVCGLIMFGIVYSFLNFGRIMPSAGTSYTWVSAVFGKPFGFFAGWALLVLCCIFMVSATIPAANATLLLFAPDLVNNVNWVTGLAALWLTIISAIVVKGVKMSSKAQIAFTLIEGIILLAIGIGAFYLLPETPAHAFSWNWFSPFSFTPQLFAQSALVAIFFFYGWDVTLNLAEETKNPETTPGRAAFWSMIFLMAFFLIFISIALLWLTDAEIQQYNTNIIFGIAEKVLGKTWGYAAILAVLLSTIGTIETQMIQFTRTIFAKSRDGALHPRYAELHPKWQTPHLAILFIWVAGIILLFLSSYLPTINDILQKSISALGYQICFYLGLTGIAAAVHFRSSWKEGCITAFTKIIWPAISGVFLFVVLILAAMEFDTLTNVVGLGGIVIGIIPFLLNKMRKV